MGAPIYLTHTVIVQVLRTPYTKVDSRACSIRLLTAFILQQPSMRLSLGLLASLPALVASLASTDSYRDADAPQSGYLPNHNLNPNIAGSSGFKSLWTFQSPNAKENWLAKPLVYTPNGGSELVITASEMNIIRVFDGKTGKSLMERTLQAPFLAADSNCGDIPDFIGVTGTPIIDPNTDIMYLFSKGYRDGTTSGTANGVYKMYALRIPSLEDVSGFPTLIDGINADNDRGRYLVGGVALQRPALTELNGHIVAAFGSHCGRWNYTGYIVSVSKTPGVGPVSMWATEAAPGAPSPQALDLANERSGKAGIWQSGMGLPTIGNNVYFVAGNGQGHANGNVPASGRISMSTLDECIVKMELSATGKWSLIDYFQPYDYVALDAGDRDVGSSGLAVLDGSVFKGAGVNRIGVTAGKKGRTYVVNADNLGGFRQAADGGDGVLQTIELGGSLYGGFGSYPAEGGYIYATTVGGALVAYKLGFDSKGVPQFSLAGQSSWISAGRVGVGQMTVTSDNGKAGSGIVWITDVNTGLMAFKAIPQDGVMVPITLPSSQGTNKYQRPVFGDGRVFFHVNANKLVCFGAPVNSAVNCTSPLDFGSLELGSTASATVSCKANVALAGVVGCSVADASWSCSNSTLPQGAVAAGTSFSLNVTWDLSNTAAKVVPGFLTSAITLAVNASADYAASTFVTVQGTVVKQGAFLKATPSDITFGRLVLRDSPDGLTATALLQNIGNGTLTFTGFAWQDTAGTYTNFTNDGTLGAGFTSSGFPAVGSTLDSGKSLSVPLRFFQSTAGSYSSKVVIWSNGGSSVLTLSASVNDAPAVTFELSDGAGNWNALTDYSVAFGNVLAGTSVDKQIRVCNKGGAPLTITISKPPATPQLFALNPTAELTEGTQVAAGTCAIGSVGIHAAPVQPNHPSQALKALWTISSDGNDPTTGQASGLHNIAFSGTVVSKQVGPLLTNGTARYQWVGCFQDTSSAGRNLQTSVNTADQQKTNTLQQCQTLCLAKGYILSGVQYHQECWCGGSIKTPSTYRSESLNLCTFDCTGDDTQACGGDGGHMSLYADITSFDIAGFYASLNAPSSSSSSSVPAATSSSSSIVSSSSAVTVSTSSASGSSSSSAISSSSSATGLSSSTPATSTVASSTLTSSSSTSSSSPSSTMVMSPINSAMPAVISGQWQYSGCYKDLINGTRLLAESFLAADDMTLDKCAAFCSAGAYNGGAFNYFGVEYSRECFCGWDVKASQTSASESDCSMPCAGSKTGLCGGGARLSVYSNTIPNKVPSAPQHAPQAGNYKFLGCQTEGSNTRALTGAFTAADTMTVEACATFCSAGNWQYMGVEYARECFCGNTTNAGSLPAALTDCNMVCKGNALQYCGSGGRLDLYTFSPASSSSSSSTVVSTSSTIISSSSSVVSTSSIQTTSSILSSSSSASPVSSQSTGLPSSSSSVVQSSSSASSSSSAAFTGQTASDSSSSSAFTSSSSSPIVTSSSQVSSSSVLSSSSSSSSVVAFTTISVSSSSSAAPPTSSSSTIPVPTVPASTTASSSSLASTTAGPTATPTNGYYYIGCFQDSGNGHALPGLFANNSGTPELCIGYANSLFSNSPTSTTKLPYVFMEYHHECYGGGNFEFNGAAVTSLVGRGACKDYCYGSVSTFSTNGVLTTTTATNNYCGGPRMFDLYALSTAVAWPTTGGPLVTQTVN
ncbi:WSC domain-containing protein [Colletotrichum tamarilloi]|uniref:WSC domain-containing protein n=1 Tax=Colletotrichum tamarilloi TaxID=1209934 RepID=A0ABQ9QWU2_9PEZI|nr:WSC domain-containing protein [Colletotrichum tamarilloi]KAK1487356.1 WSC domain-containing protein [Colletotrichum tamarilloi]